MPPAARAPGPPPHSPHAPHAPHFPHSSQPPHSAHPRRTPRALLTPLPPLLLLLTATLLTTAPPALARSDGWSLTPLGGGRPAFYAEGAPGTVLRDTVAVTNRGRAPVTVRLRGTGVSATLARAALTVPARTRAEVPFTVTVPRGAAPGDRTGAIVARDPHGRTASVPVRLRVGGPALPALTVEHLAVHADRITYELVNRGTTVLVPRLAVRADGVFGRLLDRAPRTLPVRLPPGARRTLSEPWPGRPVLGGARVRLTVTAAGGAYATASTSAGYVPWGAVAGAAAVATAGTAVLLRRRHRARRARPGAAEPAGAAGAVS
ncbi:hypothetical protein CFC35_24155 [Streptomyces sp. FBKL.4005]|uniref:COG1470 family protein n=1 Tax=Streptomyces sp. FBKL.4005 TaxID=2015515 RepID=UPI000B9762D9|nr:hypothetical protein [Streptomyces sp. FBKL.4005]OYP17218.1 hypothetical protein CFC35_24155 [Streptomyces sp. FBKL.4005]